MDIVEEIRNKISLVDLVSQKVKLTKKGREYIGNCPFHTEKSPSFYVNPTKGFYYCFGCGAKGNAFNFCMEIYHISFREALQMLATQCNIVLDEKFVFKENTANDNLYKICKIANEYFVNNLYQDNPHCKNAYNYLIKRGLTPQIIKDFQLGYASFDNKKLFDLLLSENIYEEDILEVGLKSYSQNNNDLYEFFRNRIIFPITNPSGKIIAFGGRVLDDSKPKYLNTKESHIFHKKNTLFALSTSLNNLKHNNNFIVVEGYLDVIALHQFGFKTAIAPLGTAISSEHLLNINKYDKNPIFCLDSDIAGQKAISRVIDLYLDILDIGMNPKFIINLEEKDPDSFLQSRGEEKFKEVLSNSQSISQMLLLLSTGAKNLTLPEVSSEVINTLINKVSNIKNSQLKFKFIEFFKNSINNYGKINNKVLYIKSIDLSVDKIQLKSQNNAILLVCIVMYPQILTKVEEKIGNCSFENPDLEKVRCFFIDYQDTISLDNMNDLLIKEDLLGIIDNILSMQLVSPIVENIKSQEDALIQFNYAYNLVMVDFLRNEYQELLQQMRNLLNENKDNANDNAKFKILQEKQKLILTEIQQLTKN